MQAGHKSAGRQLVSACDKIRIKLKENENIRRRFLRSDLLYITQPAIFLPKIKFFLILHKKSEKTFGIDFVIVYSILIFYGASKSINLRS